ncbi:hypothetical protein HRM2_17920 [Desulforapulum autotrophicum HRM2]|uniref:Uncharacterized protein n=1 Tax=Desulforapulum autotrophicum (strain ATCC 43914 / DSM 3382 / VKM B-1955 / HRM2) TaxID=177437 RepID=C0QB97_DESAH|nr:hypothetical protein [Desulforapulum autotrophicum]ACN14896.1 hypothetical protein HRM2_17920 [Desulforapulum autotrophicum HRM2]
MGTAAIIAIAAVAIFFIWNTNRAKNVIKARLYKEYGYDPEIEKLGGAELMKMNDRMDAMGTLKDSSLKTALELYQKNSGIGQALTSDQFELIVSTSGFKDIDSRYKALGLTNWGALAWLSAQHVGNVLKLMEDGKSISTLIYDVTEKMACIGTFIFNQVPELKLTKKDMTPIENAALAATQWLNETESP